MSTFIVPNAGGLQIRFDHRADKDPSLPTWYFGGVEPLLYTQRESFKFTDHLCNCLRQLPSHSANVLALRITSRTHEPRELLTAVHEMSRHVARGDDSFFHNKGFSGFDDFLSQSTKLSAVCVIPHTYSDTIMWENPNAAHSLTDSMASWFKFTVQ